MMLFLRRRGGFKFTFRATKLHFKLPKRISHLHTYTDIKNIPDYYGILGVPRDASLAEIKNSFLELSKKYHPDLNIGKAKEATEKFLQIKDAYNNLSDPALRHAYNSRLDNVFSFQTPQENIFRNTTQTDYPSPENVPSFIKWLDNTFPTLNPKQSRRDTNRQHFKVILVMLGVAFLWYFLKQWQVRGYKGGLTKLERDSAKNEEYLRKVEERAKTRTPIEHLTELQIKSDIRSGKNSILNNEK